MSEKENRSASNSTNKTAAARIRESFVGGFGHPLRIEFSCRKSRVRLRSNKLSLLSAASANCSIVTIKRLYPHLSEKVVESPL